MPGAWFAGSPAQQSAFFSAMFTRAEPLATLPVIVTLCHLSALEFRLEFLFCSERMPGGNDRGRDRLAVNENVAENPTER